LGGFAEAYGFSGTSKLYFDVFGECLDAPLYTEPVFSMPKYPLLTDGLKRFLGDSSDGRILQDGEFLKLHLFGAGFGLLDFPPVMLHVGIP